ncbi:hypothetical protein GW17_00028746 [Ensete ventricosum]|nr:hypothetical protein GW17_00028746 [Ensete ventricosum]
MTSWVLLGAGSSFSPKKAITPLAPIYVAVALHKRCCPRAAPRRLVALPRAGAAPASGLSYQRPPLQAAVLAAGLPLAALQRATATFGYRRQPCPPATAPAGGCPCKGVLAVAARPLVGGLGHSRLPLAANLAVGGRPCLGLAMTGRPSFSLFLLRMHTDGEDEGGQVSFSVAVSTRWIFVAKLLQSDLATLAQKERGEYEAVAKAAAHQL